MQLLYFLLILFQDFLHNLLSHKPILHFRFGLALLCIGAKEAAQNLVLADVLKHRIQYILYQREQFRSIRIYLLHTALFQKENADLQLLSSLLFSYKI